MTEQITNFFGRFYEQLLNRLSTSYEQWLLERGGKVDRWISGQVEKQVGTSSED